MLLQGGQDSVDYLVCVVLALLSQRVLSKIHEPPTTYILAIFVIANAILFNGLFRVDTTPSGILLAFIRLFVRNLVFLTTAICATSIYRLLFHPLRRFPGNRLAALTKLYETTIVAKGKNSPHIRELHAKYGDFIRTGPNELSINNVEAIPAVFGRMSFDSRGPFYEVAATVGEHNLITTRSNKNHQLWRRIWDQAFRTENIKKYNTRVEAHVAKMALVLERAGGRELNAVQLFSNMTFDIMADLGFGIDEHVQDSAENRNYMKFIYDFMSVIATLGSLRNVCDLLPYLPPDKGIKACIAKGEAMLEHRLKLGKSRQDVSTYLLGEDEETGTVFNKTQLLSNVELLIIAGADTTSTVLSSLFRELAFNPEIQRKAHEEVDTFLKVNELDTVTIADIQVKDLPYIRAVIDETLRLWNPLPSGAQAITGPDGVTLNGTYMPPRTVVRTHHLAIMTDERYFPRGREFIPERWTERPELVKTRKAFIPFSYGPHQCAGKKVAMNELLLIVPTILERYRVEFGESYNDEKYLSDWKDHWVAQLGELPLRFISRR